MAIEIHTPHGVIPHRGIDNLRAAMQEVIDSGEAVQEVGEVTHYHTGELYGRRLAVPAGTIIVTRVHITTHITMILKGRMSFVDQNEVKTEAEAGDMWITHPGTQRAIYCHEDSIIANVHAGDYSQFDDPVEEITFDTMAEYEAWAETIKRN
jgi:quercetin dioxygenase-like cupin family protein